MSIKSVLIYVNVALSSHGNVCCLQSTHNNHSVTARNERNIASEISYCTAHIPKNPEKCKPQDCCCSNKIILTVTKLLVLQLLTFQKYSMTVPQCNLSKNEKQFSADTLEIWSWWLNLLFGCGDAGKCVPQVVLVCCETTFAENSSFFSLVASSC